MTVINSRSLAARALGDLAGDLSALTPSELVATMRQLKEQYPGFPWEMLVAKEPYALRGARDEWSDLILDGFGFFVRSSLGAGAAGTRNRAALWNVVGSGKIYLVKGAWARSAVAQEIVLSLESVNIGLNLTSASNLIAGGGVTAQGNEWRADNASNVPQAGPELKRIFVAVNAETDFTFPTQSGFLCVLPEGRGLQFTNQTLVASIEAGFLFAEVPNTYS